MLLEGARGMGMSMFAISAMNVPCRLPKYLGDNFDFRAECHSVTFK